jgi:hypothetical protein
MGTDTEGSVTGLSLLPGRYYYLSVKAQNNAGLWSNVGFSDGILVGTTCHVATTGSDATGEGSMIRPYRTIQRGIDRTSGGCVVVVANGTYKGEGNRGLDFGGRAIIVRSENGPESCIIDCEGAHRGFSFQSGEGPDSVVDGFTIQNGYSYDYASMGFADSIQSLWDDMGEALEFLRSRASTGGSLDGFDGSDIAYDYESLLDNDLYASLFGGGIICINSSPTIKNNVIVNCLAAYGGGIYCANSSSAANSNSIMNCSAMVGSGIACEDSSLTMENNVIANNAVAFNGGGIWSISSAVSITNNTIADNSCFWGSGGGIYCEDASVTMANTILWNNIGMDNALEAMYLSLYGDASIVTASYLDIQGGLAGIIVNDNGTVNWGEGNIDADPLFADAPNEDYHLTDCSPCNAAGTSNGAPETDIESKYRPNPAGTNPDMGAYELAGHPVELRSVLYDVLNTTLIFKFECQRPIRPELTNLDAISMEVGDSGDHDIGLYNVPCPIVDGMEPGHEVAVNIQCVYPAPLSLALAAFVTGRRVDVLLESGAFTDIHGNRSKAVLGTDDKQIQMMADGLILGIPGDVTGDGAVSANDAAHILQAAVNESAGILPIYDAASHVSEWLTGQGYPCDVALGAADVSGDGNISAYDAALTLQQSGGFLVLTPARNILQRARKCRLNVNNYNEQKLEVSIDLDDVSGVYSADIVMAYDPSVLAVADVSGTPAVTGWLLEHGSAHGSVPLRISLAGASQPVANGPFITVSFDILDAGVPEGQIARDRVPEIMSLDIVEFRLNDGMLETTIESLPEAFVLLQNYPNPFNPETWIPYQLSAPADVSVTIYSVNGQMVRRLELGDKTPGYYVDRSKAAYWDGRNEAGEHVASGIYFYTIHAGNFSQVKKLTVVK